MNRLVILLVCVFVCSHALLVGEGKKVSSVAEYSTLMERTPGIGTFFQSEARTANPPSDLSVLVDSGVLTLSWTPVPNAAAYKIESSTQPSSDYTDVTVSGTFGTQGALVTWSAPVTDMHRFYRVRSISGTASNMILVVGGHQNIQTGFAEVKSFYMGKYEVTQSEYQAIMGENPSYFSGNGNLPVEQVSWYNAIEYCNRKSISENLTPCYTYSDLGTNPDDWTIGWDMDEWGAWSIGVNLAANGYRLPGSVEWCYAAKGGINTNNYTYSGSNNAADVAWYLPNSGSSTHAVGTLSGNEIGIFDMSGNVCEWNVDEIHLSAGTILHGFYGGAWNSSNLSIAYHLMFAYYPEGASVIYTSSGLGFRVCRNADGIVQAPEFTPNGGAFTSTQIIQITCPTVGSDIYYTTDGTEPTENSNLYSGSITVSQSQILKARAYRSDLAASVSATTGIIIGDPATQMILVPGGTYNNGTEDVTVPAFYMDIFETTQVNYAAEMGFNPSSGRGIGTNYPVYSANWFNAIEYCNRRSLSEGFIPYYSYISTQDYGTDPDDWPSGWDQSYPFLSMNMGEMLIPGNYVANVFFDESANGYRLPSDIEWVFAAKGGNLTHNYDYSGSNDISAVAWYNGNSGSATHAVGTKSPNELGIYDMSGNVWEWSNGSYQWDPGFPFISDEWQFYRNYFGGSWGNPATSISYYSSDFASYCLPNKGFRVCRNGLSIVPVPIISPLPGIYHTTQTITIVSSIAVTEIRYTTDGSEPTASTGTIYSGPFQVSTTQIIKAIACKTGWVPSDLAVSEYTISTTLPENYVYVHGGTFQYGNANITLSDFCIDRYELTQSGYQSVMGTNPSWFTGVVNGPVERVSWFDAIEYCNRRSIGEGLIPCYSYGSYGTNPANWPAGWNLTASNHLNVSCNWTASGYRLPTDMEWFYAARGAQLSKGYTYSGSNIVGKVAWYYGNGGYTSHPVGTKLANEIGICDMSGNIREWVWNIYDDLPTGNVTNPTGPVSGSWRALRNGSWNESQQESSLTSRWGYPSQYKDYGMGFRVCKNVTSTVATPVFSIPGGTYQSTQTVMINCATQGAQIRYTVDNTEPTETSSLYTSSLTISTSTILNAKAFKDAMSPSNTATAVYNLSSGMILISGGSYTMGDTRGGGLSDQLPTHSVSVSPYYLAETEVTQAEWESLMGTAVMDSHTGEYGEQDNFPMYWVTWYQILVYCNTRSIVEGLTPVYTINGSTNPNAWGAVPSSSNATWNAALCDWSANGYRIPTEAEWEFAARGGTNNPDYLYSGSDTIADVSWYDGNNNPYGNKAVGTKNPNALGLYDMSGSVWEWCWDYFGSYSGTAQIDPTGPTIGTNHIMRGGSWYDGIDASRVSYRYNVHPWGGYFCIGFRIGRSYTAPSVAKPVFSVPGGIYSSTQTVSIACGTPGAEIRFTTNSSEPTQSSSLYSAPLTVSQNTTLKAIAFKTGYTPSATALAMYSFSGSMILVEGGTFHNGTSYVTVSPFMIDKFELTQASYQTVMGTNPANTYGVGGNYPVYFVSWYNAIEYCNKRSINEGLVPCYSYSTYGTNPSSWPAGWNTTDANHTNNVCNWSVNGYRLPTEMEWQFAAAGGIQTHGYTYSGSNNVDEVAWYSTNAGSTTHIVGTKAANELGIFDMSGNVWEWCWDIFGDYPTETHTNPHGASNGLNRVMRGGNWSYDETMCVVTYRNNQGSSTLGGGRGFRICRSMPQPVPSQLVFVNGGTFNNGVSNVTLSSFYMSNYEVSQPEWQEVMGNNPSSFLSVINGPVETVSWYKAIEYCNRKSIGEGLTPCYSYSTYGTNLDNWPSGWNTSDVNHTNVSCNWTANGYRLPTEAEWEFAARGGTLTHNYTYSGSNTIDNVAWYISNAGNTTHTVGTKTANELGLFDLSGNVWEWVWDIYGGYPGGSQTNPHGAASGSNRVVRGGGWDTDAYYCPVSFRSHPYATYSNFSSGIRICRNAESFVYVSAGTFNNGVADVTLSPYYVERYETTQAQYQAVMGTNPATGYGVGANYPVYNTSWYKAIEYCNRRSMNDGFVPCYSYSTYGTNPANWPSGWNTSNTNHTNVSCDWTADGYRLLTEMEWMYAAMGGNLTHNYTYSGSNDANTVAWFSANSSSTTHIVGTKATNEFGIYDMSGNVWEWVWDINGSYPSGVLTNPIGPSVGTNRAVRGGSLGDYDYACAVSFRAFLDATLTSHALGFRIGRTAP